MLPVQSLGAMVRHPSVLGAAPVLQWDGARQLQQSVCGNKAGRPSPLTEAAGPVPAPAVACAHWAPELTGTERSREAALTAE